MNIMVTMVMSGLWHGDVQQHLAQMEAGHVAA